MNRNYEMKEQKCLGPDIRRDIPIAVKSRELTVRSEQKNSETFCHSGSVLTTEFTFKPQNSSNTLRINGNQTATQSCQPQYNRKSK